jgi:hypothetical protein
MKSLNLLNGLIIIIRLLGAGGSDWGAYIS